MRILLTFFALLFIAANVFAQEGVPLEAPSLYRVETTPTLESLTGVGATPLESNVRIRQGPGIEYATIGVLKFGSSIHVSGYNGYDLERTCSHNLENDLDMWVQVIHRNKRAWIARCTVEITGDMSKMLVHPAP